jgi:hypothetical protein
MNTMPIQGDNREEIRKLVDAFVCVWPNSEYGPAHIALSDYNLLDSNISFCQKLINDLLRKTATADIQDTYKEHSREELNATLYFLDSLRFTPEDWRDIHCEEEERS